MRSVLIHKCCVHVSDYFFRIELKNWCCWVKDYKKMFVLDFVLKVKYIYISNYYPKHLLQMS